MTKMTKPTDMESLKLLEESSPPWKSGEKKGDTEKARTEIWWERAKKGKMKRWVHTPLCHSSASS